MRDESSAQPPPMIWNGSLRACVRVAHNRPTPAFVRRSASASRSRSPWARPTARREAASRRTRALCSPPAASTWSRSPPTRPRCSCSLSTCAASSRSLDTHTRTRVHVSVLMYVHWWSAPSHLRSAEEQEPASDGRAARPVRSPPPPPRSLSDGWVVTALPCLLDCLATVAAVARQYNLQYSNKGVWLSRSRAGW